MIISEIKKKQTSDAIASIPEPAKSKIKNIIENATVLLTGGGFTGSGVLLYSVGDKYYVLTAAHNILINAKGKKVVKSLNLDDLIESQDDTSKLILDFKGSCSISFNAVNNTKSSKKISDAILVADWCTDLCLLSFHCEPLEKPCCTLWGELNKTELEEKLNTQSEFLRELNTNVRETKKGKSKYVFIQAGYGMPDRKNAGMYTGTLNDINYRVVSFIQNGDGKSFDIGPHDVEIDDSTCLYKDVFLFASDKDDTSMPGDSGGPIYGVELCNKNPDPLIYLVGITLGSDFYKKGEVKVKDDSQEPDGYKNNAATSTSIPTQPFLDKFD
ncbi:hypothetical protein HJ580_07070 [Dickeya zeae]|nr:hypothetical protein C1O30_07140 [Dickeya zeae]UJR60576.1 hypothetical protein HJ580_07070 [Dickeya zeae]